MESPKKTSSVGPVRAGLHYTTMILLVIANLATLGLAIGFAAVYGQGNGNLIGMIETRTSAKQAYAATMSTRSSAYRLEPIDIGEVDLTPRVRATINREPLSALVVGGTTQTIGSFSLQAFGDTMLLRSFAFNIEAPDQQYPARLGIPGNANNLKTLELWTPNGSSPIGTITVNSSHATITPSLPIQLSRNQQMTYLLKARFATLEIPLSPVVSGSGISTRLTNVDVAPQSASLPTVPVEGLTSPFPTFSSFRSIPTVITQSNSVTLTNSVPADTSLIKFSVTANSAGPVALAKLTFINEGSVANAFTGFRLYVSDSSSVLGDILADENDIVTTASSAGSINWISAVTRFDMFNDDPKPHTGRGITESITIDAGATKYFTLQARSQSGITGTFKTRLVEDQRFAGTRPLNVIGIESSTTTPAQTIWSDINYLLNSSSATNTRGWFNGFRVRDIP